jgi:hypothetical protein
MLRLIHNQTVQGAILIDDIDDQLPNKEVHRLGSTADPKAYKRDGYANEPKQKAYVPYSMANAGFPTIPGYINLNQTSRVILSAGKGKIFKFSQVPEPGLITVVSLTASLIVAPVVTASAHGPPVTIAGITLSSVAPDITSVTFAQGTGVTAPSPATFTVAQIIAGSGTASGTAISIPGTLFTGQVPVAGNTVTVTANELPSNAFTLT